MTGPPINPDEIAAAYQRHLAQQNNTRWEQSQYAQPDDRSGINNLARGAMTGLATSGYSTMGAVGKLLSHFGQNVGDELQQSAESGKREAQNFYDPHGTSGRMGEMTGEFAGTGAQLMAPGAAMKGFGVAAGAAEGATPWAARIASKVPVLGKYFPSAVTGAVAAIPGSAAHAGYTELTKEPYDGQSAGKTFLHDEEGAALLGGLGGAMGKLGRRVGSMLGKEAPVVGDAIGEMPPAPSASPEAKALDPNFNGGVGDPMMAGSANPPPGAEAQAAMPPGEPDVIRYENARSIADAAGATDHAQALKQTIDELSLKAPGAEVPAAEAPATGPSLIDQIRAASSSEKNATRDAVSAAQPPRPKDEAGPDIGARLQATLAEATKDKPRRAAAKAETPAEAPVAVSDNQAKAEVQKPAAKEGRGGVAKAKPVESNSGTGAQGAPSADKSAPAKKPAAPKTAPAAKSTPVTRKNAVAEKKGRIAPKAGEGGLTPKESTTEADNEAYIKTTRELLKGLTPGSPAHTQATAKIAEAEAENAALKAKRNGQ